MRKNYQVDYFKVPSHKMRKTFELPQLICDNKEKWLESICDVVRSEVSMKPWGWKGRSILVVCEDIITAEEVKNKLNELLPKNRIEGYMRNDVDEIFRAPPPELGPGDIIVATNLAGRGTDFKIKQEVQRSGGLCVLLTFLTENTRVEEQVYGRTGRAGAAGSDQLILNRNIMLESMRNLNSIEEIRKMQDRQAQERIKQMEQEELREVILKEELFAKYCRDFKGIVERQTTLDKSLVTRALHECWGMWLETKDSFIKQGEILAEVLNTDLENSLCTWDHNISQSYSPINNLYHILNMGSIKMKEKKYQEAMQCFEKATKLDSRWSPFAHYNIAFCHLQMDAKT